MLNLNKIHIFDSYHMYQTPLTPEGEDEYVYNYLTEKRLGEEIQVGCPSKVLNQDSWWCRYRDKGTQYGERYQ